MKQMRWSFSNGRAVTWDDGIISGDEELVTFIEIMVEPPALNVYDWGIGDQVAASLEDWDVAYWTLAYAFEALKPDDATIIRPPYPFLNGATDQPDLDPLSETPSSEPTRKNRWLEVMLKGRARQFASRSEAGRYAAYVRWSKQNGVVPASVAEWKQANATAPANEAVERIKQMVSDLEGDLDWLAQNEANSNELGKQAKTTIESIADGAVVDGRPSSEAGYQKWAERMDALGVTGQYVDIGDTLATQAASWTGNERHMIFLPTPRTLEILKKVQAVGAEVEAEAQKRITAAGLDQVEAKMTDAVVKLARELQSDPAVTVKTLSRIELGSLDQIDERLTVGSFVGSKSQSEHRAAIRDAISEISKLTPQAEAVAKIRRDLLKEINGTNDDLAGDWAVNPQSAIAVKDYKLFQEAATQIPTRWVVGGAQVGSGYEGYAFSPSKQLVMLERSANIQTAAKRMGVPMDTDQAFRGAAFHEMTHYAEHSNPALRTLTNTFYTNRILRTSRGPILQTDKPIGQRLKGRPVVDDTSGYISMPDELGSKYAGRSYPVTSITKSRSSEVLTVGVDHLLSASAVWLRTGFGMDADYKNFVMGALVVG